MIVSSAALSSTADSTNYGEPTPVHPNGANWDGPTFLIVGWTTFSA